MKQDQTHGINAARARLEWAINHPGTSDWLKAALQLAKGADPIIVQNDIEMLRQLILPYAAAQIDAAYQDAG